MSVEITLKSIAILLSLFTSLSKIVLASPPKEFVVCENALIKLASISGYKKLSLALVKNYFRISSNYPEPYRSRLQTAFMNSLEKFLKKRNAPVEFFLNNTESGEWLKSQYQWEIDTVKKISLKTNKTLILKELKNSAGIYVVEIDSKKYIFRPFSQEATPKKPIHVPSGLKSHIAARVAEYFSRSDIIPGYETVRLKVKLDKASAPIEILGSLSHFIEGRTKIKDYDRNGYSFVENFPNRQNINDNSLIQFLLNNDDIHYENFFRTEDNRIVVFDQNESLTNLLPSPAGISVLGTLPPFELDLKDIKKIRMIASGQWKADFWDYLPREQQIAFMFRAQVLIEYAKLLGQTQ